MKTNFLTPSYLILLGLVISLSPHASQASFFSCGKALTPSFEMQAHEFLLDAHRYSEDTYLGSTNSADYAEAVRQVQRLKEEYRMGAQGTQSFIGQIFEFVKALEEGATYQTPARNLQKVLKESNFGVLTVTVKSGVVRPESGYDPKYLANHPSIKNFLKAIGVSRAEFVRIEDSFVTLSQAWDQVPDSIHVVVEATGFVTDPNKKATFTLSLIEKRNGLFKVGIYK